MQSLRDKMLLCNWFSFQFSHEGPPGIAVLLAGEPSSPTAIFLLMTTRHGIRAKGTAWGWGLIWPPSAQKLSWYVGRLKSISLLFESLCRGRGISLFCLYAFASSVFIFFAHFSSSGQLLVFPDLIHLLFPPENYPDHLPYAILPVLIWRDTCGTLCTVWSWHLHCTEIICSLLPVCQRLSFAEVCGCAFLIFASPKSCTVLGTLDRSW